MNAYEACRYGKGDTPDYVVVGKDQTTHIPSDVILWDSLGLSQYVDVRTITPSFEYARTYYHCRMCQFAIWATKWFLEKEVIVHVLESHSDHTGYSITPNLEK